MIKPEMIQEASLGNFFILGCPKCNKRIDFPAGSFKTGYKPTHCNYCKEEFDWRDVPFV